MPPEPRVRQQKAAPHETCAAAACHHIRTYKVRAVPGFLQGKGCIEQADLRLLPPARDRPVAEAPCPAPSRAGGLGTTRTQHQGHCPLPRSRTGSRDHFPASPASALHPFIFCPGAEARCSARPRLPADGSTARPRALPGTPPRRHDHSHFRSFPEDCLQKIFRAIYLE